MKQTENYGFNVPEEHEFYDVAAQNAVETACEKANALTLGSCEVAVIELG